MADTPGNASGAGTVGDPSDTQQQQDTRWMQTALALARQGIGVASPNPTVGCVVVREGQVVGRGFHQYAQRDHAEVVALKEAGEAARGATAYVTLEPCSHYGRTGPCARALIEAGVARVVAATTDPNPLVQGRGLAMLREAGLGVAYYAKPVVAEQVQNRIEHTDLTSLLFAQGYPASSFKGHEA